MNTQSVNIRKLARNVLNVFLGSIGALFLYLLLFVGIGAAYMWWRGML